MAESLTSYNQEDREVQSLTRPGITVITAPPELHQSKEKHFSLLDVNKTTPSPDRCHDDDDDSDHTSDLYQQHMKGRVSPSPYTANTERARQFNTYVRSIIEERLDTLIPISHQPRDLVQQIISDAGSKFPEFASSVRKRIRTYLKSYRRSKRVKDMQAAAAMAQQYPLQQSNGIQVKDDSSPLINIASISLPNELTANVSSPSAAIVTINSGRHDNKEGRESPIAKKPKLLPSSPAAAANNVDGLSSSEVLSLRQLIQSYRESAAFLNRAADQLEEMLMKEGIH